MFKIFSKKTPKGLGYRVEPHYLDILHYIFFNLVLLVIGFVLLDAMYLQYVRGELPCPLCLLQRLAFIGIGYGIILQIRNGYNLRHVGISMLFIIYLLIVSVRQSLLDIIPRPNHAWIGSAVFGYHLPVWSFFFSILYLLGFTLNMIITGMPNTPLSAYPRLQRLADILSMLLIIICGINLVSIVLQCGIYICHTTKYLLI